MSISTPCRRRFTALIVLLLITGCGAAGPAGTMSGNSSDPKPPQAPALETVQLELKLKVGDRIPLRKTVEQEITHLSGPEAETATTGQSRLEMLLGLTVESIDGDGTRCSLRYDRIRFSHDDGRRQTEFDSASPPVALPLELAAYQGMIGHGFSFWIGPDHRIVRVAGFADFVKAALRDIPPENRDEALLAVEASAGEDSVTDFLSNTIGLLPRGASKSVGDTWRCPQQTARPVPMHIDTLCTLRELNEQVAVIDLRGDVTPVVSTGIQVAAHEATQMVVERGTTVGECMIFRDSGLPKESRLVQEVDLAFNRIGKPPIKEHKRVTTTIQCYPPLRGQP